MNTEIEFSSNRATEIEIADHLLRCDANFIPPLNSRVGITGYANKIAEHATRFEAWAAGEMIGLVAAYCNNTEQSTAYITSVSVLPAWQGKSIASELLEQCARYAGALGLRRLALEVDNRNVGAIKLYEKQGFIVDSPRDQATIMHLNLARTPR
jgi:ribosomal protein S18 acetylase RimI-like enzyme